LNKDIFSVTDGKLNVKQKQKLFGAWNRDVHAVDLVKEWSDRRGVENLGSGKKEWGRNLAPARNSGYTELDIFRMTSSPSPAPSPNAPFALLRCALWRQPTGGA